MKLEEAISGTYTVDAGYVNVQGDVNLSDKNLKKNILEIRKCIR